MSIFKNRIQTLRDFNYRYFAMIPGTEDLISWLLVSIEKTSLLSLYDTMDYKDETIKCDIRFADADFELNNVHMFDIKIKKVYFEQSLLIDIYICQHVSRSVSCAISCPQAHTPLTSSLVSSLEFLSLYWYVLKAP